jgi:hypothetical protein
MSKQVAIFHGLALFQMTERAKITLTFVLGNK